MAEYPAVPITMMENSKNRDIRNFTISITSPDPSESAVTTIRSCGR
jgi:hypothetical protein